MHEETRTAGSETIVKALEVKEFRAADLAEQLQNEVLDADDAARLLGIARNSIEYAAYRHRIPYVQYGAKKLFTRADLLDYNNHRGRGRDSKLEEQPFYLVKPPAQGDGRSRDKRRSA